jgi:hypothetical protein
MGINGDRFIMLYMCLTFKKGYKWGQVYYALHVLNIQKKVMYYLPVPYSDIIYLSPILLFSRALLINSPNR